MQLNFSNENISMMEFYIKKNRRVNAAENKEQKKTERNP